MTKTLFLVVQICAGCAFALAQAQTPRPTQSGSDEATLMQFERDQSNAWGKGDSAVLDRMLAADFVFTDYEGQIHTKAQILADLKSGAVKPGSSTVSANEAANVRGCGHRSWDDHLEGHLGGQGGQRPIPLDRCFGQARWRLAGRVHPRQQGRSTMKG